MVDEEGFGGQPPIYHTVNSIQNYGFDVFRLLLELEADLSIRVRVRHLTAVKTFDDVTPLGYALGVPRDGMPHPQVVDLLRLSGGEE